MTLQLPVVRSAALALAAMFLLEGFALTEVHGQGVDPALPAPVGATSAGGASAPTLSTGEVLLAAAPTASTSRKRRKRPTRRRRKPAPLRLPAVTPYGIPRLNVKAAYV